MKVYVTQEMVCTNNFLIFVYIVTFLPIQLVICHGNIYVDDGGPKDWPNKYPQCGGNRQSPINLPSICDALRINNYGNFRRSKTFTKKPNNVKVSVTDHGVEIKPTYEYGEQVTITGGPLQDTYVLEQIHFHWGSNNSVGSEHTIKSKVYALETHAVHYNFKYGSFKNAINQSDGLLVIAYVYYPQWITKSKSWNLLTKQFVYMSDTNTTESDITGFPALTDILPPFDSNYYTYSGSLTTPPCSESVTWIVSGKPVPISTVRLRALRGLYGIQPGAINNFRPVQPLNGRLITVKINEAEYILKCIFGRIL
ncbi:carbonic anhydrase 7-like [Onthophagus taurus]|uniref:carbonic anhydrase 7-like n=1 Tax=Onthophagus taurus TaxID=166361 RepID=UPI000C205792|nr:carbonic anhydrase 7-like [Onthophagus taurus]